MVLMLEFKLLLGAESVRGVHISDKMILEIFPVLF